MADRHPYDCSPKMVRAHYANTVRACEAAGIGDLDMLDYLPGAPVQEDTDVRWFRDHGVSLWLRMLQPREPRVFVPSPTMSTAVDDLLVGLNSAVTDLLTVPSVTCRLVKLARAGADERHLFIALGFGSVPDPVFAGLHAPEAVPGEPAELPDGLTHLWISESLGSVLGCTREGWTAHRPPLTLYPS